MLMVTTIIKFLADQFAGETYSLLSTIRLKANYLQSKL